MQDAQDDPNTAKSRIGHVIMLAHCPLILDIKATK
jgi:hypothetical protein